MKKLNARALAGAVIGAAAVAGALAMVEKNTVAPANVEPVETGKEKCFGVVTAGENACASQGGGHTCGGLATLDYSGQEWTLVASGSCQQMGGKLQAFDGVSTPPAKTDTSKG
jgi:uncharacterized membrane protein